MEIWFFFISTNLLSSTMAMGITISMSNTLCKKLIYRIAVSGVASCGSKKRKPLPQACLWQRERMVAWQGGSPAIDRPQLMRFGAFHPSPARLQEREWGPTWSPALCLSQLQAQSAFTFCAGLVWALAYPALGPSKLYHHHATSSLPTVRQTHFKNFLHTWSQDII